MIASEVFLGVKPSAEYLFAVIASSVGAYFKGGAPAVSLWISENYTRAAPGGTGAAKCGGNRSDEHTSELQSLMRTSYAAFCLKKKRLYRCQGEIHGHHFEHTYSNRGQP